MTAPSPARARQSKEAARLLDLLMRVSPETRRVYLTQLSDRDLAFVLAAAKAAYGTRYAIWRNDPVGFVEVVLGDALWSKQREILCSVRDHQRTAVPSCFGSSKTRTAACAVLWWVYTNPPGTAKAITVAPLWRHVAQQTWPEIRAAHERADLPGTADMTQLKVVTRNGGDYLAAYGIAASPHNEAAVQGIHAPHMLVVVEEAGGLAAAIGQNLRGMLTGDDSHMLSIGNPPTEARDTWFEQECNHDAVHVIPISVDITPNLSGELTPRCRSCPPEAPVHRLAKHLVDRRWKDDTITERGADSPFVRAKVEARFPRGGPRQAIPDEWVELGIGADEPAGDGWARLADLGLVDESAAWLVRPKSWVRLGVDVASDGGDELAISRSVGDLVTLEHTSSGTVNANAVDVAGVVLGEIARAEQLRAALGTDARVRVKIDANGLGWGVASLLEKWGRDGEGRHDAEIVAVIVSEDTGREPDGLEERPWRKRDEMWLAGRTLLRPRPGLGVGWLRLRVDRRTRVQLSAPRKGTNPTGHTVIEGKKSMRERGIQSPDRAEAVLLAVYEPAPSRRAATEVQVVA